MHYPEIARSTSTWPGHCLRYERYIGRAWPQTSFKLQQYVIRGNAINNVAMNKIEPKASPYNATNHGAAMTGDGRRNMNANR